MEVLVDTLLRVIEAEWGRRYEVFGHSMGCADRATLSEKLGHHHGLRLDEKIREIVRAEVPAAVARASRSRQHRQHTSRWPNARPTRSLSVSTVRNAIRAGRLPALRISTAVRAPVDAEIGGPVIENAHGHDASLVTFRADPRRWHWENCSQGQSQARCSRVLRARRGLLERVFCMVIAASARRIEPKLRVRLVESSCPGKQADNGVFKRGKPSSCEHLRPRSRDPAPRGSVPALADPCRRRRISSGGRGAISAACR